MKLDMTLTTENLTRAEVKAASSQHVTLTLDQTEQWNAAGLLKLSAMLQGVAAMLKTGERPWR
jgi:hypothetical protein